MCNFKSRIVSTSTRTVNLVPGFFVTVVVCTRSSEKKLIIFILLLN